MVVVPVEGENEPVCRTTALEVAEEASRASALNEKSLVTAPSQGRSTVMQSTSGQRSRILHRVFDGPRDRRDHRLAQDDRR